MVWPFNLLFNSDPKPEERTRRIAIANGRSIRARYDASQTGNSNSKHWAATDSYSADALNSAAVRSTLRDRARYEIANNGFCGGQIRTLGNDIVGFGPQLQIKTGDPALDSEIEESFQEWAEEIEFWDRLRTMVMAWIGVGEGFGRIYSNSNHNHPVQLDLQLIEADQVSTPDLGFTGDIRNAVDGIEFDEFGNPTEYHILRSHPGSSIIHGVGTEYDRITPENIIHLFDAERPGQHRGVPRITPSLELYAKLRRYASATVLSAEFAASISGILQTRAAPMDSETEGTDIEGADDYPSFELEHNTVSVMPEGWVFEQIDPKQPTAEYDEFTRALLREAARPLCMPMNVALGDSSGYNYASGRLDHREYFRAIAIDQKKLINRAINPMFRLWRQEWLMSQPRRVRRAAGRSIESAKFRWYFSPHEHVDPVKEAQAWGILLERGLVSREYYWQTMGLDPETMRSMVADDQSDGFGGENEPIEIDEQDDNDE